MDLLHQDFEERRLHREPQSFKKRTTEKEIILLCSVVLFIASFPQNLFRTNNPNKFIRNSQGSVIIHIATRIVILNISG